MAPRSSRAGKTKRHRSRGWLLFDKVDEREAMCRLCFKRVRSSGNTSNLLLHIKQRHPSASDIIDRALCEEEAMTIAAAHLKQMPENVVIDGDAVGMDESDCSKLNHTPKRKSSKTSRMFSQQDTDDVYEVFGRYVAYELKALNCDNLRRKLKRMIQQVIVEVNIEEERIMDVSHEVIADEHVVDQNTSHSEENVKLFNIEVINSASP